MKHAQRTEKYLRLIFNSYISDDDFFQKSMHIIEQNPAHYITLNTVFILHFFTFRYRSMSNIKMDVKYISGFKRYTFKSI
jgi:hypothetical protein